MICVHDLWKSYNKKEILKGLNIEISEGITVILGRSGVGKSVLLRHIIGIEKPDKGYVKINGINISHLQDQKLYKIVKNMGMLFQGGALFDSMTIKENTAFYLEQHKNSITNQEFSKSEIDGRVDEALKMVGLNGTQNQMPANLSGGMRKRAALARLIIYKPKILLYDEPTAGLDPITSQQINELILKIQQELKATSIVVTHDINSAITVGDKLALHHDGQIVYIADKESFIHNDHPIIKGFFTNYHKD